MKTAYAHSLKEQPTSKWQSLAEHALNVAQLAKSHAGKFGAGELGEIAGLMHDLSKYSDEFQRKLNGAAIKVDHATAGARDIREEEPSRHPISPPSLHGHYSRFIATTRQSAPLRLIGTFGLAVVAACAFPLASPARFSRSAQEPE